MNGYCLRELLAEDGSIWLHCDYRQVHRLHLLLEEVFGVDNYLNTIAWRSQVTRGAKVDAFYFPFSTQYIEVFAKNRRAPTVWHPQRKQLVFTRRQAAARFMEDEGGFFRTSDPGTYSFESLVDLHAQGRLYAPYDGEIVIDQEAQRVFCSNGGNIGVKYYLEKVGRNRYAAERGVDNLWDDIPGLGTTPGEDVGYPTQKTEALLRRIIGAATDPGDWVLDAFAGSGTTPLVAQQMGRRWLACDANYGAVQTIRRRLQAHGATRFDLYGPPAATPAALTREECKPRAVLEIQPVEGNGATIEVHVRAVRAPAVDALLAEQGRGPVTDWRGAIESIEIDPAYDGERFRPVLADAPQGKRSRINGRYTLNASSGFPVAVRITDVLGNEELRVIT
ncbi:MAG: site-specific DNA-methyltransferase [Caldilineaceae bacterium]|nr:site-specific DNA-methyltransferase [Caldilineaceae bacterium]